MEPKFFSAMANTIYSSLWNKYRPAIIQLMVASQDGPQKYKLYDHEFKSLNPKEKGYTFALHAFQGKATNNIKTSVPAQDLLAMLNMSKKAVELMTAHRYEFTLDRQFFLHISRVAPVVTPAVSDN
jgi:hypothetical protein